MKGFVLVSLLVLLLASHLANSRSIGHDQYLVSDGSGGGGSFLPWRLSETTVTCDATYGFLPCSDNVLGLLFLILVYEILLSIGAQYVDDGSTLFFQIIGPGLVGGSVFQMLGTIPQLVMVLGEYEIFFFPLLEFSLESSIPLSIFSFLFTFSLIQFLFLIF